MIIDGLKNFLIRYYDKEEHTICPIKNFQESFHRSIIQLKTKAIVIEYHNEMFEVEVVDNSANVWKTLDLNSFKTEQEVFKEIARILDDNPKLTTRQRVALRENKIIDFIKKNKNKKISLAKMAKELNYQYQEISTSITYLKKGNRIAQNTISKSHIEFEVLQ